MNNLRSNIIVIDRVWFSFYSKRSSNLSALNNSRGVCRWHQSIFDGIDQWSVYIGITRNVLWVSDTCRLFGVVFILLVMISWCVVELWAAVSWFRLSGLSFWCGIWGGGGMFMVIFWVAVELYVIAVILQYLALADKSGVWSHDYNIYP